MIGSYVMVVYELSDEDGGGFVALAPDLPGCMGDGDSRAAAVADLEKAMEEWIDEAVRLNRKVPKPGDCFVEARAQQDKLRKKIWSIPGTLTPTERVNFSFAQLTTTSSAIFVGKRKM